MTEGGTHRPELKNTGYEIFIGILSILSIVNLVLLYAIQDPGLDTVLWVMNAILSAIFLIDFTYRLFTAESKTHYFFRMFGWADLLASLPVQQVKVLRVFRLVRVFRLLRAYGAKNVARSLLQDRAGSALLTLLLMGILVLEFGSLRDPPRRAEGRRGQHHSSLRRPLVHHRHHLDRRLRRPVSRHQRGTDRGLAHHRHRRRHLRHLHRLPGQPLPLTVKEAGSRAITGRCPRPTGQHWTAAGAHGPATERHRRDQPAPSGRPTLRRADQRLKDRALIAWMDWTTEGGGVRGGRARRAGRAQPRPQASRGTAIQLWRRRA